MAGRVRHLFPERGSCRRLNNNVTFIISIGLFTPTPPVHGAPGDLRPRLPGQHTPGTYRARDPEVVPKRYCREGDTLSRILPRVAISNGKLFHPSCPECGSNDR